MKEQYFCLPVWGRGRDVNEQVGVGVLITCPGTGFGVLITCPGTGVGVLLTCPGTGVGVLLPSRG